MQVKVDAPHFYDGAIDIWKPILGSGMHYHMGDFSKSQDPEIAFKAAVRNLYPYIPKGSSLCDIGCGWGGPLQLLIKERECEAIGITPSPVQYEYVSRMGISALLGKAEDFIPEKHFDVILLMESFSHILDKKSLLEKCREYGDKIILIVNCQDYSPPSTNFGGSMEMISSNYLRNLLVESGWNIVSWTNRRMPSLPSIRYWHEKTKDHPPTQDHHLETLRHWSTRVVNNLEQWGEFNPLIEVVAE